jgi:hypothetical protein
MSRSAPPETGDTTFGELRAQLRGELATPGEPGYELCAPWNAAVRLTPRAVVSVADVEDIERTIRFAAENELRVTVQCTGHGAAELGPDDVIMIHTGRLDEIEVDPDAKVARVGAGVAWQAVIEAAHPYGLAPVCGAAPGVGVVGMTTGGGIGPLVRSTGAASDRVRAFELVTGAGRRCRATADSDSDLFWALRGGKATVGIVSAIEIDLIEAPELYAGALYFAAADVPAVTRAWSRWARDLPEHASTSLAMLQLPPLPELPPPLAGKFTVAVRFASTRSAADCEPLVAPLREIATPVLGDFGTIPYTAIGSVHADPPNPTPAHEQPALLRELPDELVQRILELAGPGSGSPQLLVELRLLGGELARGTPHASAFCHRDSLYSLVAIGVPAPGTGDAVLAHGCALIDATAPWATGGVMPNFGAGNDLRPGEFRYDPETLTRLRSLSAEHDPAGVLRVGRYLDGAPA